METAGMTAKQKGGPNGRAGGQKKILVVDDERDILDLLRYNFEKEGWFVETASNGEEGLRRARFKPDMILLDIMLPGLDGWEVFRALKQSSRTAGIPVIFLTAKNKEVDEVLGLELGADDYIVKPINIAKLIARVNHVLRTRKAGREAAASEPPISIGEIEIHPYEHVVLVGGKEVFFPRKEFELLHYLARNRDRLVDRDALLKDIWGTSAGVIGRTIDVHIRKIRIRLGVQAVCLETVKGIGYKLRSHPGTAVSVR